MPFSRHLILFTLSMFISNIAMAGYIIEGKINMKGDWQNQIYLATIDRLDDYYSANSEFVINVGPIDNEGNFIIEGDNLPEHPQFYKLYLLNAAQSEFDACLFVRGENHNFAHLLLDNDSRLTIQADTTAFAPFGDYQVKGSKENKLMKELRNLVYPSYIFHEIKFPAELKFSRDKLNRDLFNFVDTCSSTMVSLAAINNTDFDNYFETHHTNYRNFSEELKIHFPEHPYAYDFSRKMRYYGPADESATASGTWKVTTAFLAILLIGLLFYINSLRTQLKTQLKPVQATNGATKLTGQEIKILQLINVGKSNKEIAGDLFIEVSTVKSHINKLYSKLGVKNRSEAIKKAQNQAIQGL